MGKLRTFVLIFYALISLFAVQSALETSPSIPQSTRIQHSDGAMRSTRTLPLGAVDGNILFHNQHKCAGVTLMNSLLESTQVKKKRSFTGPYALDLNDWRLACAFATLDNTIKLNYDINEDSSTSSCVDNLKCELCMFFWGTVGNSNFLWKGHRSLFINSSLSSMNVPQYTISLHQTLTIVMFREPVSRLMSSLYYCRETPSDPLCGSNHADWYTDATPLDMAELQGNIAFREFLAHPKLVSNIKIGSNSESMKLSNSARHSQGKAWEIWKRFLAEGGDPAHVEGKENLKLLIDAVHHNRLGMVFGLLGRWSDTMRVFDCLAPLVNGMSWAQATAKHRESHGSQKWKVQQAKSLAQSRENEQLLLLLNADIQLYEAVENAFDRQIRVLQKRFVRCAKRYQ